MKHLLFMILGISLFASIAFAQDEEYDGERFQQLRQEFFNRELELTPEESTAFWTIFRQFKKDQRALRGSYEADKKLELLSDADVEGYINQRFELEEKELALRRKYYTQLRGVIPIRKIAMIDRTERKFKQTLLRKIQERKDTGPGGRRQGF